jgi:flagellar motor switch protein FliN
MRARYAELMKDKGEAPADEAEEATGDGPQATEAADEAVAVEPEDQTPDIPDPAPVVDGLEPAPEPEPELDMPDPSEELALHLLDVKVRLWAELGRSHLPLAQAVALGAGAIVDLDKEPDDQLEVFVNGLPFARASLLLVDGEWAIRLEEIVAKPSLVEQASSSGSGA